MNTFTFEPTTGDVRFLISAKLGATPDSTGRFTDKELNKLVKVGGAGRYVLAADGDEIEGAVAAVEAFTAEGYGFGTVQSAGRMKVRLTTAVAVGGLVVASAPVAVGTALTGDVPNVKAGAPVHFKWRLVDGSGSSGSLGIIERI
jgi:hypothetical protein